MVITHQASIEGDMKRELQYLQNRYMIRWMSSSWYPHDLTHMISIVENIPLAGINKQSQEVLKTLYG